MRARAQGGPDAARDAETERVNGRRGFLKAAGAASAGAAIVGFSSSARAWLGGGHGGPYHDIPHLDGELVTEADARDELGQDLGLIVFTSPNAVLRPGSIRDVQRMVRFCYRHRIQVAARGQGHATDGQAQVDAGLVIDMRTLSTIHEIGAGYAVVDGGATWRSLLEQTLPGGQSPPVLTGFIGLSIGGTLSMGGMSGMAYKRGPQIQHALELTVVTGRGNLEVCSRDRNRALFDAVLAGIGQYGIIVRAKVRLMSVGQRAIDWTMTYTDIGAFMADMRTLVGREELDMVWGGMKRNPATGAWIYELYTTMFYDAPAVPDMPHLHRGLSFAPGTQVEIDGTYWDYQTRVDGFVAFLRSIGHFEGHMHPWFDVFVPSSAVEPYVGGALTSLGPDDVGIFGVVLIFPLIRRTVDRPMFRLPDEELVFLFDILDAADFPGYDADYASRKIARNRTLFEQARALGGTRYPIGTLRFDRSDWAHQYGREWIRVNVSKTFFDPRRILTPGPGIF